MIEAKDNGNLIIEGNASLLINQVSGVMAEVAKTIAENDGRDSVEDVYSLIMETVRLRDLISAGMDPDEAIETLGLKGRISYGKEK